MRDVLKSEEYFNNKIEELNEGIKRFQEWIRIGKTPPDRINIVKRAMVWDIISLVNCKYSQGTSPIELKFDLLRAIDLTYESWDGFWLAKRGGPNELLTLNQYGLDAYDQMLWMLSLGFLLNISDELFNRLIIVIDRDKVKDALFEFILSAKIRNRPPIREESYFESNGIPTLFFKLRTSLYETNNKNAEKLVEEFIREDWYRNHKDSGWYNSHKSKNNIYCGYWSYETAAIVKIKNLDDSSFRDCPYYPADLVNVK
ncbi:MAG: DUF1911 domain-containing protein [Clostridiaceae bacterium]|nr:DUF1911 domain-containing protein [Clostridiaceae bacterium]